MDTDAILAMSPEERLELIERLWESLEPRDIALTPAQRAELNRRLDTLEEDAKTARPWDDVRRDLDRLKG